MTRKLPVVGKCRICGENKRLTEEHVIPRKAGGGARIKLYSGDELMKTLGGEKPYGKIHQNGHAVYTLCADCNNLSGRLYDEDFADFYNMCTQQIPPNIAVPKNTKPEDYLENKKIVITLEEIKPFNIAKRILVSFCSVEHPGLMDRKPEIRKTILNKDYQPKTDDFSIYLSLHLGNPMYYGTVAALINTGTGYTPIAYAGIEEDVLAFHFADHDEHLKGEPLISCLDITSWLTRYAYDQVVNVQLELKFNKSLMVRFPIPK